MFMIREAQVSDQDSLLDLAKELGNAGSLPQKAESMREVLERARESFESASIEKTKATYLFVLEDFLQGKILGCTRIRAKHGTPEAPQTFLRVLHKKRMDPSTETEIDHQLLRFEFEEDGPTEIGGLILHPSFRNSPSALGRLLAWSRFVYIGMNLNQFEDRVVAELLPPFNEDGKSELWEAFGRRFTNMSYQDADQLSKTNKHFIKNLFPTEDIYTRLFSPKARAVIGEAGDKTKAAQRLLEKVGFSYMNIVDPFDGGPYFEARTKEISVIKRMQRVAISAERLQTTGNRALLAGVGKNGFVCFCCHVKKELKDLIQVSADVAHILEKEEVNMKDCALVTPL